jgi:hypothetical protein
MVPLFTIRVDYYKFEWIIGEAWLENGKRSAKPIHLRKPQLDRACLLEMGPEQLEKRGFHITERKT